MGDQARQTAIEIVISSRASGEARSAGTASKKKGGHCCPPWYPLGESWGHVAHPEPQGALSAKLVLVAAGVLFPAEDAEALSALPQLSMMLRVIAPFAFGDCEFASLQRLHALRDLLHHRCGDIPEILLG